MSRQSVPMRRELRTPKPPKKAAHVEFRYSIEGERLTLAEIVERCPSVKPQTVKRRVTEYGLRTWADLRRGGSAAMKANRDWLSRGAP